MVAAHEGIRTTALDFAPKKLHHLGATLLEAQEGWTSTSETRSPTLLRILPAQGLAPHFASTSICSAFCQHKPQDRLCPLHLWACPECDRLCILLLSACSEFCLGIRVGSGPRTISDKVRPYAEDFMGPSANLHLESGRSRSSRQPGLLRSPCRPRWVRQKPKRKRCRLRAKSASDRDSDRLAS